MSRTTRRPSRAWWISSRLIVSWDMPAPGLFPAKILTARGRHLVEQLRAHEAIVHDDVGLAQQLEPANRDEAGIARSGADEGDAASPGAHPASRAESSAVASSTRPSATSARSRSSIAARHRSAGTGVPALAHVRAHLGHHLQQKGVALRHETLQLVAHDARQGGARSARGHGHHQAAAAKHGGEKEVTALRIVGGVHEDAGPPRVAMDTDRHPYVARRHQRERASRPRREAGTRARRADSDPARSIRAGAP